MYIFHDKCKKTPLKCPMCKGLFFKKQQLSLCLQLLLTIPAPFLTLQES